MISKFWLWFYFIASNHNRDNLMIFAIGYVHIRNMLEWLKSNRTQIHRGVNKPNQILSYHILTTFTCGPQSDSSPVSSNSDSPAVTDRSKLKFIVQVAHAWQLGSAQFCSSILEDVPKPFYFTLRSEDGATMFEEGYTRLSFVEVFFLCYPCVGLVSWPTAYWCFVCRHCSLFACLLCFLDPQLSTILCLSSYPESWNPSYLGFLALN